MFGIALSLASKRVRRNCADLYVAVEEGFMEQIAGKVHALQARIRSTFEAVPEVDSTYEGGGRLDIPVGTARSRVSRVRAAVRAEWRGLGGRRRRCSRRGEAGWAASAGNGCTA